MRIRYHEGPIFSKSLIPFPGHTSRIADPSLTCRSTALHLILEASGSTYPLEVRTPHQSWRSPVQQSSWPTSDACFRIYRTGNTYVNRMTYRLTSKVSVITIMHRADGSPSYLNYQLAVFCVAGFTSVSNRCLFSIPTQNAREELCSLTPAPPVSHRALPTR